MPKDDVADPEVDLRRHRRRRRCLIQKWVAIGVRVRRKNGVKVIIRANETKQNLQAVKEVVEVKIPSFRTFFENVAFCVVLSEFFFFRFQNVSPLNRLKFFHSFVRIYF